MQPFDCCEIAYRKAFADYTLPNDDCYRNLEREYVDHLLLNYLHQMPALLGNRIPIDKSVTDNLELILMFKLCGGSKILMERFQSSGAVQESQVGTGKRCGYVFTKGDGIFRCKTCGLDETCVLCTACFRSSNHEGHQTTFSYAAGSGGFCDCGDAEAWKIPLSCAYHNSNQPETVEECKLGEHDINSIRKTIATLFYFLCASLYYSPKNITKRQDIETIMARNPSEAGIPDSFSAMIWNDESHSFDEVINQVVSATARSASEARDLATEVDQHGRAVLMSSNSIPNLLTCSLIVNRIGLATSISSTATIYREQLAGYLVKWILKFLSQVAPLYVESVRKLFCEELCRAIQIDHERAEVVEFLLGFDSKLWKELRIDIRALYVNMFIVSGEKWKQTLGNIILRLGERFCRQYHVISQGYLCHDREYDLSVLNFSVQLFTVPSVAEHLLFNTEIIQDIICIIKAVFISGIPSLDAFSSHFFNLIAQAKRIAVENYQKLSCGGDFIQSRLCVHFFNDIRFILGAFKSRRSNIYPLDIIDEDGRRNINRIIDLCLVWQGMHSQVRLILQHVEFENENWVNAFNLSLQISSLLSAIAASYFPFESASHSRAAFGLALLLRKILLHWSYRDHISNVSKFIESTVVSGGRRAMEVDGFHNVEFVKGVSVRIPDYRLEYQEVSFHHPVHWLYSHALANICKLLNLKVADDFRRTVNTQLLSSDRSEEIIGSQDADIEALLFEYPLRSVVFASQIRAGMWVRNGLSMRTQAAHYKDMVLRPCSDADLFLIQVASVTLSSDRFLTQLLDRFNVTAWFSTEPDALDSESHQTILVQDLLKLLITVISERSKIVALPARDVLRREVIHHLAAKRFGLPFSELSKRLPSELLENEASQDPNDTADLEMVLKELADFKFPGSVNEKGMYHLKDEYYAEVSPWFHHYTRNEKEQVEEVFKERLKSSKISEDVLNRVFLKAIKPGTQFAKLGMFVNSRVFVTMIFLALWTITRSKSESGKVGLFNDMILSECIFLTSLAISLTCETSQSDNFIQAAAIEKFPVKTDGGDALRPTSLLELFLSLVDRAGESDIKEHALALRKLINKFDEASGVFGRSVIAGWRDKSSWTFAKRSADFAVSANAELDEKQRKKLESKQRKAAVMAQFQQAQASFMANYGDELEEDDESMEEEIEIEPSLGILPTRTVDFPTGSCIVCQDDLENSSKLYGMLTMFQPTSIRYQIDFLDHDNLKKNLDCSLSLDVDEGEIVEKFESLSDGLNGTRLKIKSCHASTCGHLMHLECFENYQKSIRLRQESQPTRNHAEVLKFKEFICPLCKNLGNALTPVIWSNRVEKVHWWGANSVNDLNIRRPEDDELTTQLQSFISTDFKTWGHLKDQCTSTSLENVYLSCSKFRSELHLSAAEFVPSMPGSLSNVWLAQLRSLYSNMFYPNVIHFNRTANLVNGFHNTKFGHTIWLIDTFSATICSNEISSRMSHHLQSGPDLTTLEYVRVGILDRISTTTLSFLAVLSETCISAVLFQSNIQDTLLLQFCEDMSYSFYGGNTVPSQFCVPLLSKDSFSLIVYFFSTILPLNGKPTDSIFFHWIRLFALVEAVRTIVSLIEGALIYQDNFPSMETTLHADKDTPEWLTFIIEQLGVTMHTSLITQKLRNGTIFRLLKSSLLIFARRCVILLHSSCGIVPPGGCAGFGYDKQPQASHSIIDCNSEGFSDEWLRLRQYLGLPDVFNIVALIMGLPFRDLVSHWCAHLSSRDQHWNYSHVQPLQMTVIPKIRIEQIIKPDFISLPYALDDLLSLTLTKKCQKCQQVPYEPAICLVCGTYVCNQSFCCVEDGKGESYLHSQTYFAT